MRALLPPPRMALSEWIETNLRLPEGVSASPGRVRLWAPQRGIADAISDPEIERVTLVKPVRVGFTTLLTGTIASYVANDPSPILALLPTEADCRDYVVSDIEPIFESTPALQGLLSADADESSRNTLLSRRFPGGSLKVIAAKAPRNLRRHNVRILLVDEADAMESGAEGSPLVLAERRTLSFANRKIIVGGSPIYEETSNVLRAYAKSDGRLFEVPCPDCGTFTEILWRHIEWESERPETAAFRCPHCDSLVSERHKPSMVENGCWRATRPDVRGHAGFRINALVSTLANASWGKLAAEFLTAKTSPDTLQVFVNTFLAEGWKYAAEQIDESDLASRVEPFDLPNIPPDVLLVTVGVDVQHDRLEIVFLGFGRTDIFILGNQVIWGSPLQDDVWLELDDLLKSRWRHPAGGFLKVDAAAVDSGDGGMSDIVTAFCKPRFSRRIVAIKGASGFARPAIQASASKGSRLFICGVDAIKAQLMARLAKGRSIRFSDSLEPRFFEEMCSERIVIRYTRGQPTRLFDRIPGKRAECLDSTVYAIAARALLTLDLDRREAELAGESKPAGLPTTIRSAWLDR
jgi:phage terminase large subunit GpA-like protein